MSAPRQEAVVSGADAPDGATVAAGAARLGVLDLPWPPDWSALFGRRAPLILEIGFGRGEMLFHLAARYPDHDLIGVEVSNQSLVRAERRIARGDAANVRVVHASAEAALAHLLPPASLAQVHVNFPDPWFKKRHHGRRVMRRETLDALVSRLAPGGTFHLATDIEDYAELAQDLLAATEGLDNLLEEAWSPERMLVPELGAAPDEALSALPPPLTKYEQRAIDAGRPRYFFAYRRNDAPAPAVPLIQELAMPHVALLGPLDLDQAYRLALPKRELRIGERHLAFLAPYRGEGCVLLEAFVREPTIAQRLALVLKAQEGRHVLGLGTIGRPRPTLGAHLAVALWARSLMEAVPGLSADDVTVSLAPEARALLGGTSVGDVEGEVVAGSGDGAGALPPTSEAAEA